MKEISKQTWQVLDPSIVYNRQIAKDSHSLFRGMDLEFFQILIEGLAGQMIRLSKSGTRMVVSWELSLVIVNGFGQNRLNPLICSNLLGTLIVHGNTVFQVAFDSHNWIRPSNSGAFDFTFFESKIKCPILHDINIFLLIRIFYVCTICFRE